MAVHMPPDAGSIHQVQLPDDIRYSDGELTWSSQNGKADDALGHLKDEEIIAILDSTTEDQGYSIFSLRQGSGDVEEPFQLSAFSAQKLPQDVLDKHRLKTLPDSLRVDGKSDLHVIISTRSGTGLAEPFYNSVLQPLLEVLGLKDATALTSTESAETPSHQTKGYHVTVTKDSQTIREFAQARWGNDGRSVSGDAAGSSETIVLLSGDGGVVDLLNGCDEPVYREPRPTIALLPLGTGNALFHSLHKPQYMATDAPVPSPFVLALRTLLKGVSAPLPTFQASFSPGSHIISYSPPPAAVNADPEVGLQKEPKRVDQLYGAIVASYGFHSQLVWESDTPEYRKHGEKRFGMVAQELLKESHVYDATVETLTGGKSQLVTFENTKFNYILATLVSNLEKTFAISPKSKPLDGQLRLVHFGDVGGAKTMDIMMQAYNNGSHVGMTWTKEDGTEDKVGYEAIDEVKVTTLEDNDRWRKVCIDGTIVEIPQGGSMTVKTMPESKFQVLVGPSVL
ncbi:putative diacylglycerol kinase catalytic domain-containing protein [Phaeoacremonium minimum UCRPA7]|uniref:Putative diacylglycerol kinase catalytic domain-containing protein n=1 Tax=Phaeoacremonium minimum (strain UCR-PA7) TaxID=1286976 RepID=R8BUR0_PHAM7|nr:putative diacylglycerol kinase catalytic domain-containing protein [Phaeoacremonium minimum UCRPA7]EOO03097.1 putative diacylglycerol kinase catalytic domain-containing protein [Phaeoacremonium minimum UCRPA7]